MLTQERLKQLFSYDENTGLFTRLIKTGDKTKIGEISGTQSRGYIYLNINKTIYLAHRLAWFYTYGVFPSKNIDHINRIKNDNRISNLREVNQSENMQNQINPQLRNKSGFLGVSISRNKRKYYSRIAIEGVQICLGSFDTAEEASSAYLLAKTKYHIFSPLSEAV